MIFIPFPGVEYPFGVDSSFIYGARHGNIDKLTASKHKIHQTINLQQHNKVANYTEDPA